MLSDNTVAESEPGSGYVNEAGNPVYDNSAYQIWPPGMDPGTVQEADNAPIGNAQEDPDVQVEAGRLMALEIIGIFRENVAMWRKIKKLNRRIAILVGLLLERRFGEDGRVEVGRVRPEFIVGLG